MMLWPIMPGFLSEELHTDLGDGLLALLEWDGNLMDGLTVPDGIDRQLVIDTIVERWGQRPLWHPDPDYMKYYIPVWCNRNMPVWKKLYETTLLEYNPIENYNRAASYTDTENSTRNTDETGNVSALGTETRGTKTDETSTNTATRESTHTVSAENVYDYQPDYKDNSNDNLTGTTTGTQDINTKSEATTETTNNRDETYNRTLTHEEHVHGNIGVTTSQEMLKAQRDVVMFNIVDVIADSFAENFCLQIY